MRTAPTRPRTRGNSAWAGVYQDLREQIVSVALDPGSRLSENELAAGYGVSRTPVREALIRLADDGLVEVFPQLGTYVSRISVREVREAQFIREALETAALPLVAERAGPADYTRLEAVLAEQRAARADGDLACRSRPTPARSSPSTRRSSSTSRADRFPPPARC
jgi:DNA-binding GntR family transcriptional regulator